MQFVLAFLALLVGAALAGPMTILTPDDLAQENRDISSKEYLKKMFEGKVSVSNPLGQAIDEPYEMIMFHMAYLELYKAMDILDEVDLGNLLGDVDLESITLCLPSDEAIEEWRQKLPKSLEPSQTDLKNLVKAWIVDSVITTSSIRNNEVRKSVNGALLRFNKYHEYDVFHRRANKITTVNGARIARPNQDIPGIDSIIHVVDKVIYPLPTGNVIETLVDVPAFSRFMELVNKAELVTALSITDPITMFIPTNDAIDSLPNVDDLVKNKTKINEILRYHVLLDDTRYSASMLYEERIITAHGAALTISPQYDGEIYLQNKVKMESKGAKVLAADIPTTNGVLHIIDRVLTPPDTRNLLV